MQRAVKDLSIEQSLKTYEEVWLSKIFEMREHTRNKLIANADKNNADPNAVSCSLRPLSPYVHIILHDDTPSFCRTTRVR